MVRTTLKSKKKGELLAASKDASRDVLPRTGFGLGSTMIDSASKMLTSYGKFIVPALALIIVLLGAVYFITKSRTSTELEFQNRIDRVAMVESLDELRTGMEVIIAEAEDRGLLEAYAHYRYGVRAYQLLERPYVLDKLESVIGVLNASLERLSRRDEYAGWQRHVAGLQSRLLADLEFLQQPDGVAVLPWTHRSEAVIPEPRLVGEDARPIVVYETSVGTLRVELDEDQAPNAVYHKVSLMGEGFYNRTNFTATAFSNAFNPTGPFAGATVMTAGREGRPVGVELKKPTTAADDDDVDSAPERNPYTIRYEGNPEATFVAGSIGFIRDTDEPTRARTEFFVVIEPSDTLRQNFLPIGRVLDGEAGLAVARRLHNAEIYYTYVEQKREGVEYVPMVYYDGWPVAMRKRSEVPAPVRFGSVETEIVPVDSGLNPLIVIEVEAGDIVVELFEDIVPNTVANFINLIEEGFYNTGCSFYRVEGTATEVARIYEAESPRIIQGGFSGSLKREGYEYVIRNEAVDNEAYELAGLANVRGTIAMARRDELDSASTEFFINLRDWPAWDSESSPYCVFGEVKLGLDVAARVKANDEIRSIRVIRKRDREYVPTVRYEDGAGWVEKRPVEIPSEE